MLYVGAIVTVGMRSPLAVAVFSISSERADMVLVGKVFFAVIPALCNGAGQAIDQPDPP